MRVKYGLDFFGGVIRRPVQVKVFNSSKNPLPQYKSADAAACDVCAAENASIAPGETRKISTGLWVEIPETWKISVLPRSGLGAKGITIANSPGTIDADYRGEICILVTNGSQEIFEVREGDRIAQLEISPVFEISWVPVDTQKQLGETLRGDRGFGHTGLSDKPVDERNPGQ